MCDKEQLACCTLLSTPQTFVLDGCEHDQAAAFWTAFESACGEGEGEGLWLAGGSQTTGGSSMACRTFVLQRYLTTYSVLPELEDELVLKDWEDWTS